MQYDLINYPKKCGTQQERECSPEYSTDGSCDATDTYQHTERDGEMGFEQHHPIPTNARSLKYDLCHIPKSNCNEDYRY